MDAGVSVEGKMVNHGSFLTSFVTHPDLDSLKIPFTLEEISNRNTGIEMLQNNKADALIILHPSFSVSVAMFGLKNSPDSSVVEFVEDLTKTGHLISAVWANEIINEFALRLTNSLIIAAATRSANEVLVVGNFPMFLFMFFTGAAFPLKSEPLFTIAGYPFNFQGLMTPTHAISALNKTLVMNMGINSIFPEIVAILVLTSVYLLIGALLFKQRHLKLVTG